MIYEFIRSIKEMGHCVRHFFRALTCKHYYVESHGIPMCEARSEVCTCEWYWCPKRKGGDTEETLAEPINCVKCEHYYETEEDWGVEGHCKMDTAHLSERTGEWILEETDEYKRTYCSVCGAPAPFICVSDDHYGRRCHGETRKTNFCPNCGADMRGEEE